MSKKVYNKNKEERKAIWIQKVMAHGTDNDEQVLKEALDKFEKTYPQYEYKN